MPQRRVPSPLSLRRKLKGLTLKQKVALLSGTGPWTTEAEPAIGLSSITMSDGPAGVRGDRWVGDTSVNIPCDHRSRRDLGLRHRRAHRPAAGCRGPKQGCGPGAGPDGEPSPDAVRRPSLRVLERGSPVDGRVGRGAGRRHPVRRGGRLRQALCGQRIRDRAHELTTSRSMSELCVSCISLHSNAWSQQGVWTVMAAYNGVNGQTMTESPLLDSVLRDEWGFDGLVVSDWTAVRTTVQSANAGTDLAMPGPNPFWEDPLVAAVEDGLVSPDAIDDKLERLLRLAWRVGKLDPPEANRESNGAGEEAPALTREAAAASFVLERNQAGILPLDPAQLDDRRRYRPQLSGCSHARRGQRICRSSLCRFSVGWNSRPARNLSQRHPRSWHPCRRDSHGARWAFRRRSVHRRSPAWQCVCSMLPTGRSADAT